MAHKTLADMAPDLARLARYEGISSVLLQVAEILAGCDGPDFHPGILGAEKCLIVAAGDGIVDYIPDAGDAAAVHEIIHDVWAVCKKLNRLPKGEISMDVVDLPRVDYDESKYAVVVDTSEVSDDDPNVWSGTLRGRPGEIKRLLAEVYGVKGGNR